MNKINLLLISSLILISCSSLGEAGKVLRNEKTKTTDEFLVKKKEPLILPPDYRELPEPGVSSRNKMDDEGEKIKKIFKASQSEKSVTNKESSVEKSILNKIRK